LPAESGELTASGVDELVAIVNTVHVSVPAKGKVGFNPGSRVHETSNLVHESSIVSAALLSTEVVASEFGNPNVLTREGVVELVEVVNHGLSPDSVPMQAHKVGIFIATELSHPLLHPLDTRWVVGGGGRSDSVSLFGTKRSHVLSPELSTISWIHLGLSSLVDLVHADGDTIVGLSITDELFEITWDVVLWSPEHGNESGTSEVNVGSPSRPVIDIAGSCSDCVDNIIGRNVGSPSKTTLWATSGNLAWWRSVG